MTTTDKDAERRRMRIKKAKQAYDPRRVPGTPAIGFAAKPLTSPGWTVGIGEFELDLVIRSAGGMGRGVSVRVSGEALDAIELESLAGCGTKASFEEDGDGFVAQIADLEICQGYVVPLDPRPSGDIQKSYAEELLRDTHMTLTLRGRATEVGNPLMRVEIAALGATSSPLRWMRPLIVE